jgi:hypothetical protein
MAGCEPPELDAKTADAYLGFQTEAVNQPSSQSLIREQRASWHLPEAKGIDAMLGLSGVL